MLAKPDIKNNIDFFCRVDMQKKYSLQADKRVQRDYKRTKDDFYRMELNRLDAVHPLNRPHMRKAYFAYLQNTPGSRKAVIDCVKTLDGDEEKQDEDKQERAVTPQSIPQNQSTQQAVEAN